MRRILVLFTLVAALVVPAATAHAATTIEKNIPFEATLQECGETITLSGTLIGIFTEQPLGGGGLFLTFHFQPQGVSGTSSSGVPYHATGLTRSHDRIRAKRRLHRYLRQPLPHCRDGRGTDVLCEGDPPHHRDPHGEITASVDNFSLECV